MSSSFGALDKEFQCPFCWEQNGFSLEAPPTSSESMTVDCENCCRPIALRIVPTEDGYELIADK